MLKWEKLGKIFDLSLMGNNSWMVEQAQNPFAIDLEECIRVYFNTRSPKDLNGNSQSLVGYVDFSKEEFPKIINVSDQPVLKLGGVGDFDEFGTMAGSVFKIKSKLYMYYVGWTRKVSVPYNWEIGLAISDDNGMSFKKFRKDPIIGSTPNEPFLQAGCSSVIFNYDLYNLFYTSGIKWLFDGTINKKESVYQIMKGSSVDGIEWKRDGEPIIKTVIENESQASPTIKYWDDKWHMLFSYRHSLDFRNKERGYRIGYATSVDLINWIRHDDSHSGINVSQKGWDSEMICYPNLFELNNEIYLFYCGNEFGKFGFGVAKLNKL
jgi:sucrose-6-phosphate hydrolase SacC (GH32 family)